MKKSVLVAVLSALVIGGGDNIINSNGECRNSSRSHCGVNPQSCWFRKG